MKLQAHEVALEMIVAVKPLLAVMVKHDRSLADQLKRASSGVALALGEGTCSRHGNQTARFQEALASANECRSALRVAVAWGYLAVAQTAGADELLDRIMAMTWRLTHPRH
jgi:four helix bundle protein